VFSLYSAGLAVFATKKIKKVGAKWKIAGFVSKSAQKSRAEQPSMELLTYARNLVNSK
jgi:hypothetical protein